MLRGSWVHKNPAVRPVQCPQPPGLSQSIRRGAIHPRVFMIICFNPVPAALPPALASVSMLGAGAAVQSSPAAGDAALLSGCQRWPRAPSPASLLSQGGPEPPTQHIPKAITAVCVGGVYPAILPQVEFQTASLRHVKCIPPPGSTVTVLRAAPRHRKEPRAGTAGSRLRPAP